MESRVDEYSVVRADRIVEPEPYKPSDDGGTTGASGCFFL